ncbi:MAG: hypothetical protein MZV64_33650 [Ignavibacteriales bacterium]|nr:hypothetical protein [Ignavibacteriales bacterium]
MPYRSRRNSSASEKSIDRDHAGCSFSPRRSTSAAPRTSSGRARTSSSGTTSGATKDVSVLLRTVPRMIFFTGQQDDLQPAGGQRARPAPPPPPHGQVRRLRPSPPHPVLHLHGRLRLRATSPGSGPSPSTSTASKRDSIAEVPGLPEEGPGRHRPAGPRPRPSQGPEPLRQGVPAGRLHHGLQPLQGERAWPCP